VNRGLCGEEDPAVVVLWMLRGEDEVEGVVVWRGGVMLPLSSCSFVLSGPEKGRLGCF